MKTEWLNATNDEYNSLIDNDTWKLVDIPPGRKPLKRKWIRKCKYNSDGSLERYKARLVVSGYQQQNGIDYKEKLAPVVRLESLRILCAIVVVKQLYTMLTATGRLCNKRQRN